MKKNSDSGGAQARLEAAIAHLHEIHANRPSARLSNGRNSKSRATILRILSAAHDVFIEQGYACMTLRGVAEKAGIAVGNLTYHFSTKDKLVRALLEERLAEIMEQHVLQYGDGTKSALDILLEVMAYYVGNAQSSHRFFCQMWGYAGASQDAREFVRSLYRPFGRYVLQLVWAVNPKLDYRAARRIVLQIFSMEEGYKLFIGLGPDDDVALKNATEDMKDLTRQLLFCEH